MLPFSVLFKIKQVIIKSQTAVRNRADETYKHTTQKDY